MNYLITILGLLGTVGAVFGMFKHYLDPINSKFDGVYGRLDQLDARMDRLETRVDQMDLKFDRLDRKIERLDYKYDQKTDEIRRDIYALATGNFPVNQNQRYSRPNNSRSNTGRPRNAA